MILSVSLFSKRPPTGPDELPPDDGRPPAEDAPSVRSARRIQQRSEPTTLSGAEQSSPYGKRGRKPKQASKPKSAPAGPSLWTTLRALRYDVPLLRYWWVAALGLVVAIGAGVLAVSAEREPYRYTATAQIFLTSPDAPYYRTGITSEQLRELPNGEDQRVVDTNPPDTDTLVQAANLYPLLVESDDVAAAREQEFGRVPGTVEANAIFSVRTASRYRETSVPVIEISGTSGSPENAVKLADDTVQAFGGWIAAQQDAAEVKESQRILIEPLASAQVTATDGGPSYAIPFLIAAAVFLAFCGLAVMLDSLARRSAAMAAAMAERGGGAPVVIHPGTAGADGGSVREGSA